jgi:hypothetical protein
MEQSMAAAAASRPFLLLNDTAVSVYDEYSDWEMVECECKSKVAYGCGALGQHIVEGLTLLADLRSGALGQHIDDELLEIYGTKVRLSASVEAVDDEAGVLVLCVSFRHERELGDLQS